MTKTHEFSQLETSKNELDLCTQCGYCTLWCPLYQENPVEESVARGKIAAMRKLKDKEQPLTDKIANQINQCLLCGTCLEHCAEKVPTPYLIIASRADGIRNRGMKFPSNIIYQILHNTSTANPVPRQVKILTSVIIKTCD